MLQRSCYCRCAVGPICTDWGEAGSPIILFADHDWDFRPSSSGSFFFCISFVACRLIVTPFLFLFIHYSSVQAVVLSVSGSQEVAVFC